MKDLIIVCAGGYGREVLSVALAMNKDHQQWNIKGFIDDNPNALNGVNCEYGIIGSIKDWNPSENEEFAIGISAPRTKEKITNILKEKGAKFATLILPRVYIPSSMKIGEGCIITLGWFSGDVKLGKFVNINGSMVGESTLGDYCTTTGFANIARATLGKRVFVGSHAVILNGRKVGDDAFVCAGSIVVTHVKSGTKVFGNPAKKVDF